MNSHWFLLAIIYIYIYHRFSGFTLVVGDDESEFGVVCAGALASMQLELTHSRCAKARLRQAREKQIDSGQERKIMAEDSEGLANPDHPTEYGMWYVFNVDILG